MTGPDGSRAGRPPRASPAGAHLGAAVFAVAVLGVTAVVAPVWARAAGAAPPPATTTMTTTAATTTTTTTAGPPAAAPSGQCGLPVPGTISGCERQGEAGGATPAGSDATGGPLAGAVGAAFGPLMQVGTAIALRAVTQWVADSAAWLLGQLGRFLDEGPTRPRLRAAWFDSRYQAMARLAALMAGPILLLAVAQAVARQDAGGLLRAAFVHLPLAMLLAFVAVKLVDTAVTVTDVLGRAVAGGAAADAHKALAAVGGIVVQGSLGAGAGAPLFIGLVIGAVVVFAALLLWVELVLRAAAIYVAVLFLPLALAAFIWPATAHWCRRLAETLAALVLAKFVVVAVLALGFSAFQAGALGRLGGGPDALVPGASLLLLAAFAPYMLLRLIPMVEVGALAHLEGHSRRVVGSAGRAAWSAARRATAPSPAEGPELVAQEPRIGTAPGVRPAVVPLHGEDDGAASAALDQEAPLGSGGPEARPHEPRPREARGDPHLDVHFPGRPSFRAALEGLGGLDDAPDRPLGSEFAVDPPFEPGHEDGPW